MKKYKLKCWPGIHPRILVTEKFVKDNKFELTRKQEEIKARLDEKSTQFLNFAPEILIEYVDYEHAKNLLNEEAKEKFEKDPKKWKPITDIYETTQDFLDYMVFAWKKSMDQRGISSERSIQKLGEWLWLLNRGDLVRLINRNDLYNPYGMPALIVVCKQLGIEVPKDCIAFAKKKV